MTAPQVLELPLDDALLKVLSSESRREILRLLAERRMTGAELAGRLNLGKPAVSEHLKKLTDSGLIERADDPERRWVYYNLSARGRSILEPQRVRFYLVMAVASLALVLGMALALGIMVILQGGASGPADDLAASSLDSGHAAVDSAAYTPPVRPSTAARDVVAPLAATGDGTLPAAPEPVRAVTVVTVPHRICPIGGCTQAEPAETDEPAEPAAFVLVLPSGRIAPPLAPNQLYAFHPEDVDAERNIITVHMLAADATGAVPLDLGTGANSPFSALATTPGAITLSGGGTLLPVADHVPLPDEAEPAVAPSPPATDPAAATQADSFLDAAADGQPADAPPAGLDPAAQAEADAAAAPSGADAAATPSTSDAPAAPAPTEGAATGAPADGAAPDAVDAAATATPEGDAPVLGAADRSLEAANADRPQRAPVTTETVAAREPVDSAVLPFAALLAATLLVALTRRRA